MLEVSTVFDQVCEFCVLHTDSLILRLYIFTQGFYILTQTFKTVLNKLRILNSLGKLS